MNPRLTTTSAMTRQNRALTFLELIFVIAIITIFSVVAISGFRKTFSRMQLNSAVGELQALMGYLSQRSIAERKMVYMSIDPGTNTLIAVEKEPSRTIKNFQVPEGVKIESDIEGGVVVFYPDGSMDDFTLKLSESDGQCVNLTSRGVLGSVKIQP